MTSSLAVRSAPCPSFFFTAALLLLMPGSPSAAEVPPAFGVDALTPEASANENAGPIVRRYGPANSDLAAAPTPGPATTGIGRPAPNDVAKTGDDALVENGWDFTKPDSIPGFGSTPHPVLSNPEIAD